MKGKVIRKRGRLFTVLANGREYDCDVFKKVRADRSASPVAVGDQVEFEFTDPGPGAITAVEERHTWFSRPKAGLPGDAFEQVIASNLDQMVIVASATKPKFKQYLIDRFTVAAAKGGLEVLVVVNKIDLKHKLDLEYLEKLYTSIGMRFMATSVKNGDGINKLRELLQNRDSILVGHSGVGKSSLLNAVQPGLRLRTQEISDATNKGTHTTTAVELYPLQQGGYVADTPGLKILGLWDLDQRELQFYFPELESYLGRCKFSSCAHIHEPECAVKQAVNKDEVFPERYESYRRIYEDLKS